jgi:transposase-like protein
MTETQAAALRVRWAERVCPPCQHLNLELEHNDNGYLTGDYHCTACGESIAVTTRDPFQVV